MIHSIPNSDNNYFIFMSDIVSEAQAHIYAALIKIDNTISTKEVAYAPYYAEKGEDFFNIMNKNGKIKSSIKNDLLKIIKTNRTMSSEEHLNKAIELLKRSDTSPSEIFSKIKTTLSKIAEIDSYLIKESNFIKEVGKRLTEMTRNA